MIIEIKNDYCDIYRRYTLKGALAKYILDAPVGEEVEIESVKQLNGLSVPWDRVRSTLSDLCKMQGIYYKTRLDEDRLYFFKI
jgi:hypothetical protein